MVSVFVGVCVGVGVFMVVVCVCVWWSEGVNIVVGNISVFLAVYVCVVMNDLDMAMVVGSANMYIHFILPIYIHQQHVHRTL